MSKKKNTLKDLDEFLKQQAASLVTPEKLSIPSAPAQEQAPASFEESVKTEPKDQQSVLNAQSVIQSIQQLARTQGPNFRRQFYDIIIKSIESQQHEVPEDKMLINTALYLKHGEQWKDAIRQYWRERE
jgi:hypothetical protein